jgi:zinc resistance-associated protein
LQNGAFLFCIVIDLKFGASEGSMWKIIITGTAALAIASTSLAYAQQAQRPERGHRWQQSTEDQRAFGEARLAALKAGLMLTPEQEKNWPAYEQAARDFGKLRMEHRMAMRSAQGDTDLVERLRQRAAALSDTGTALSKLADATEPLYKSLDDNQKQRFASLTRRTGPGRDEFRRHRHEGDGSHRRDGMRRIEGDRFSNERFGDQRL